MTEFAGGVRSDSETAAPSVPPAYLGPSGFEWLLPGRLGGTARPGLLHSIDADLAALSRMGATHLVTLTDEWEAPADALAREGLAGRHFPIPDMGVPDLDEALELCA